jgi:hypothetical protein
MCDNDLKSIRLQRVANIAEVVEITESIVCGSGRSDHIVECMARSERMFER